MGLDAQDKLIVENLENRFTVLDTDGTGRYQKLRAAALDLARQIIGNCPDSRERSTALTQLDSALLFANAAIARHKEVL